METIFRCSEYGFLKAGRAGGPDKTLVELAALCVTGVYGAAFVEADGILHVIFDLKKTGMDA